MYPRTLEYCFAPQQPLNSLSLRPSIILCSSCKRPPCKQSLFCVLLVLSDWKPLFVPLMTLKLGLTHHILLLGQQSQSCLFIPIMERGTLGKSGLIFCTNHWSVLDYHLTSFLRCKLAFFVIMFPKLKERALPDLLLVHVHQILAEYAYFFSLTSSTMSREMVFTALTARGGCIPIVRTNVLTLCSSRSFSCWRMGWSSGCSWK